MNLLPLLVGAAVVSSAAAPPTAPKVPATVPAPVAGDRMDVTVHRLSNGMTVYLSPNDLEPRVAAFIAVRAGGRHDPDDSTGMAHYLEHMLFKGSTKLGSADYAKEKPHLDRISALYEKLFSTADPEARKAIYKDIDTENIAATKFEIPNELSRLYTSFGFSGLNAHTSLEETVYKCSFPANRAELWAKTEADRFAHPVFRLFQTELETVYEEKNRSLDNAERALNEVFNHALFKDHPYGRTVLGSIEHLKNPSLAKMYEFYDKHYRPGNMAILLAGSFERGPMLKLLEGTFGKLKARALPETAARTIAPVKGVERVEVKYEAEERVVIGWPSPGIGHPDFDALVLMNLVLANGRSGLVDLDLNQAQKVRYGGSWFSARNEGGGIGLWAVTKASQTLEQAETLLLESAAKLKAGDFSADDLKAILTNFEVSEKAKLESNWSRVQEMLGSFIAYQEWAFSASQLERLRKVTKEDVVRVANKYFGDDRVVGFRRLGKPEIPSIPKPGFSKIEIDPTRKSKLYAQLEALPAKPLAPRWLEEGRDYSVSDFPWGRLYAANNPVNDLFSVTFQFDRGRAHERSLCSALELLELSGAGDMPAEAYKKALYALGASMSVSCGEKSSAASLSGPEENFEKALDLFFARFEAPNVAPDTLKKMIEVQIGIHRDNKKNPTYVGYALKEFATRGPKSEVLGQLSDAELKALDESKLKDVIRRLFDYKRKAQYVGVRGAAKAAERLGAGRTKFEDVPAYEPVRYLERAAPAIVFAHRDMVQAHTGFFAADVPFDPALVVDEQYYDDVMGGMKGVFFQEMREARSLAYTARGGYDRGARKGDLNHIWGWVGSQADKAVEAGILMAQFLNVMPLSKERFETARKSVEETYRSEVINFRGAPGTVQYWDELGLGVKDPRPERFKRALDYKMEELERFAARFRGKPLTAYVLGSKSRIDLQGLKKLGEIQELSVDQLFPY
ncbi:MAG: insulinase family protein [Proteobacteria bacterium]|nr:insulinase family protein [Pseudomonadota bacterium]